MLYYVFVCAQYAHMHDKFLRATYNGIAHALSTLKHKDFSLATSKGTETKYTNRVEVLMQCPFPVEIGFRYNWLMNESIFNEQLYIINHQERLINCFIKTRGEYEQQNQFIF